MKEKIKTIGYFLFAFNYRICTLLFSRNKRKAFGIMTHDASKESNVGMVFLALSKLGDWQLIELHRGEEKRLSFYFIKAYHLATAGCVLQDNVFLPMAYLSFSDSVKVIQLWHGTGTIKKFGQDFNTGRLKRLEYRANQTITHLIVNAEGMKWLYQSAFGIAKEKIFALGLPRTDALFNKERRKKNREKFFKTYPKLKEKRLLLYAPTFRDREAAHPRIMLDTKLFLEMLPPEYVLGLRLHPFVAEAFSEEISGDRIINLSHYPDINTLYEVSDALITDYSSVIFDYCILNKPIYFYAYDFDRFLKEGRGTYVNLKEDMPGVVTFSNEELFLEILKADYDYEKLRQFREESYQYLDGKSTERVVKLITG